MTLAELIAALERAEGPSRELDDEIDLMALETGWRQERMIYGSPNYTASLDAALTLVPEGAGFALMGRAAKVGRETSKGATTAIALCIAAIRARGARQ